MRRPDRDAALAIEFDQALDAATVGFLDPDQTDAEARLLVRTAQRLRAIDRRDTELPQLNSTAPFDAILNGADLVARPAGPRLTQTGMPWRRRRRIDLGGVTTAAVLVLTLLGGFAVFAGERDAGPVAGDPAVTVYRTSEDGLNLVPLDALTLQDLPNASPLVSATPDVNWGPWNYEPDPEAPPGNPGIVWQASGDGSTLVAFVPGLPTASNMVMVFDLPDGRLRSRFVAPSFDGPIAPLSHDGSRLLVKAQSNDPWPAWQVIDTQDGRSIQTIRADLPSPVSLTSPAVLDPTGEHVYVLTAADAESWRKPGLWPLRLVTYDVATGAPVQTLILSDVRAGSWSDEDDPEHQFAPAIAISSDGGRLAIVDGRGSTVTIVVAAGLVVERTIDLRDNATATPVAAPVPVRESFFWLAWFDPRGQRVLVSGFGRVQTAQLSCVHAPGVRVVDIESGLVSKSGIGGLAFVPPQQAVSDLFLWIVGTNFPLNECREASGLAIAEPESPGFAIVRADSSSFVPEVVRSFSGLVQIVVVPAQR